MGMPSPCKQAEQAAKVGSRVKKSERVLNFSSAQSWVALRLPRLACQGWILTSSWFLIAEMKVEPRGDDAWLAAVGRLNVLAAAKIRSGGIRLLSGVEAAVREMK